MCWIHQMKNIHWNWGNYFSCSGRNGISRFLRPWPKNYFLYFQSLFSWTTGDDKLNYREQDPPHWWRYCHKISFTKNLLPLQKPSTIYIMTIPRTKRILEAVENEVLSDRVCVVECYFCRGTDSATIFNPASVCWVSSPQETPSLLTCHQQLSIYDWGYIEVGQIAPRD